MNRILIICVGAGTILLAHSPANAMTKCYKTPEWTLDDFYLDGNNSYWGLVMGDAFVEGVALCSNTTTKYATTTNTLCQCIATTPFVSEWFSPDGYYDDQGDWQYTLGRFDSQSECEDQCGYYCAQTYDIYENHEYLPVPADGHETHAQCPNGFYAVSYNTVTAAKSSCASGYSTGTIKSCDEIESDDQECWLFKPAGTYTDATGTYEYSEPCPWTD